jgi:1-acyl-sn-glycerol-3-phosphate acyltransferase
VSAPTDAGCPRRGSPFTRALARRALALFGWRVEGDLPEIPRFVLIVAPHTSNWDFPICVLAMFATGLRLSWLGKHTIFRFPVAGLLRWLGGTPVDRSGSQGTVDVAIENFRARGQWVLGLSPEGTRRRIDQWRTGFHRIAVGAGVPIVPVWLDYRNRVLGIGAPVSPTPDVAADMARLAVWFRRDMARHPEQYTEPSFTMPDTGAGVPG